MKNLITINQISPFPILDSNLLTMNEAIQKKALEVWENYKNTGKTFKNDEKIISQDAIDTDRLNSLPTALDEINRYFEGHITIEVFKTSIDGFNKRNPFWGFRGINGQMFFNMLYNSCSGAALLDSLDGILKTTLRMPVDIIDAKQKITLLSEFTASLNNYVADKRSAPRSGSILFFISYFWQIQDHNKWPIYYRSMVEVFQDLNIWSPNTEYSTDYEEFVQLNTEFADLFTAKEGQQINYWDVEHAFWTWSEKGKAVIDIQITQNSPVSAPTEISAVLPASFIPPVVAILPLLARNDAEIQQLCANSGISPEKAFEERIAILFKMMSYKVEPLGQGLGRVPDGIAICQEHHYAIIYDAKVRKDGYSLGTDDRAIREYIMRQTERLKRQGIRNVYFAIISSTFNGDYDPVIRALKMETDIREVLFIETTGLLTILEQKLRDPEIDLGPKGIQNLLAQSGILTHNEVKEFLVN